MTQPLDITVNGRRHQLTAVGEITLLRLLRDVLGLTGTKEGCDDSECGACMVLVDGRPVNSCSYLAHQAASAEVTTIEGLSRDGQPSLLQQAFLDEGGVQCGYCTPGMVISAAALLASVPTPSEAQIRQALAGNLCRCTGYQKIIKAVQRAARQASTGPSPTP
jgi:aerobic-type carbon monoxide dehydrogenase small subunit (CoxS/CutS family)